MAGGLYLVASDEHVWLQFPPMKIPKCKSCGQGPNLSRNLTFINFGELKGDYLAIVGKHFYPTIATFIQEVRELGVSKRIPYFPKKMKLGETRVYLAHPLALDGKDWGIFCYFVPERIERMTWMKDRDKTWPSIYTIIDVPDGDLDHSPWKMKKLINVGND